MVQVNDDLNGTYNINSQIKFKISMLKSKLCDYRDACILVNGIIRIRARGVDQVERQPNKSNKEVLSDKNLCTIHWVYNQLNKA